jgi:hypothetical protein
VGRGEEQVPQSLRACLGLQLADHRVGRPAVAAGLAQPGDPLVDGGLDRLDLVGDERAHPVAEVGGARGEGEVHGLTLAHC